MKLIKSFLSMLFKNKSDVQWLISKPYVNL